MNRTLLLAVGCGLLVGGGSYWLVGDPFVSAGTATVYVGAAYFYLAADRSLLGTQLRFDERVDRLGYGIGLFGLSVSPLAIANHYAGDTATLPIVTVFVGVIAFLLFASAAADTDAR
jgi:hypothetical protein